MPAGRFHSRGNGGLKNDYPLLRGHIDLPRKTLRLAESGARRVRRLSKIERLA